MYPGLASAPLYEIRKNQHSNIHMCRNGCFPELGLKEYNIPREFISLRRPIVLFSGALAYWCDMELIERVAKSFTISLESRRRSIGSKFEYNAQIKETSRVSLW